MIQKTKTQILKKIFKHLIIKAKQDYSYQSEALNVPTAF